MADLPLEFDLKLMPDWVKEPAQGNRFAEFTGEEQRPDRAPRSGRPRKPERPRLKKETDGRRRERPKNPRSNRPHEEPRLPQAPPPAVTIELLPEPAGVAAIAAQIKAGVRAYPLLGIARMFLEKPERHRVKITSTDLNAPLFQCGENGLVSLDQRALESSAFQFARSDFYSEQTTRGEPPKGTFTNVARCRLSGTLLGPTNHHAYQPTLRKLYEERFSRRMSFLDYQREIDIDRRPEAVEAWKEQARSSTTYTTIREPEPITLPSASEAEQHFRTHYLAGLIRSGVSFEISGPTSRHLPDRRLGGAVRAAWEHERRFPTQLIQHLSRRFIEAGLHIFRHHKRVLYVSAIRPRRFVAGSEAVSPVLAEMLKIIESTAKCTRVELGHKMLKPENLDVEDQKNSLAADLHWLIQAGHVIELHNGILETPPAPQPPRKKNAGTAPSALASQPSAPERPTQVREQEQ
jgi:hypothetical protein